MDSLWKLGLSNSSETDEGTFAILVSLSCGKGSEIGFSLFDSFAIVNPYIAWRNHILKDKPENERKWRKYGVRAARLSLITR